MVLIEETTTRKITSKLGNTRSYKFAMFECPSCKKHVELSKEKGKKQNSCGERECVLATRTHNKNSGHSGAKKHGFSNESHEYHGFYRIWKAIKSRCNTATDTSYARYGGRGITISESWNTFENFKNDMFEEYQKQMKECNGERKNIPSIDRIDNDGNYCIENCEWIPFNRNVNKETRMAVNQLDFNGNIVETFESASFASETLREVDFGSTKIKVHFGSILQVCKGRMESHCGYKWEYATDKTTLV